MSLGEESSLVLLEQMAIDTKKKAPSLSCILFAVCGSIAGEVTREFALHCQDFARTMIERIEKQQRGPSP